MKIKTLLALLAYITSQLTFGDSFAPPSSYKVVSQNQKYVFVMIAPLSTEQDANYWIDTKKNEILEIRNKYSKSGMYLNDASNKLLWSVDWYGAGVEIANDGEHVVTSFGMASDLQDRVLTFYANGSPIKSYTVQQLVKKKRKLQHTNSHFFWEKESLFDTEKNKYYIQTVDDRHFIFDITTGNIVSDPKQ